MIEAGNIGLKNLNKIILVRLKILKPQHGNVNDDQNIWQLWNLILVIQKVMLQIQLMYGYDWVFVMKILILGKYDEELDEIILWTTHQIIIEFHLERYGNQMQDQHKCL